MNDHLQLLEVVGLGQAIALIPRSLAASHQRPDIVCLLVADASPYTVALVWPADSRNRWIARFVRIATDHAASTDPLGDLIAV